MKGFQNGWSATPTHNREEVWFTDSHETGVDETDSGLFEMSCTSQRKQRADSSGGQR